MGIHLVGPSRFVASAGAAVIMAVSGGAFASSTPTSEDDPLQLTSIMMSESAVAPLSDAQALWTGVIVMSIVLGTTIWSFVKSGADKASRPQPQDRVTQRVPR